MPDPVRIGFIGCGGNARGHMSTVHQLEDATLAAVCDTVEPLAQKAAADFGGTVYTDMNRMLDEARLDGVVISIPVFAHGAPEKAAIARGIPFLVEKPVARHMATAHEIAALVEEAGLITAVGYQLRYAATVSKAREILAGQKIGLVAGTYWCGTGRLPGDRWTVQFEQSGGQLLEQATHTIDMMRYLAGEVTEVFCYSAQTILDHHDSPDANVISWRHADGALGSLTTSWAMAESDWRYANQVHLTGDGWHMHWSHGELLVKCGAEPVQSYPGGGPSIDEAFCQAVRTGDPSGILSPYADGVKSMAVSIAALESARLGRPVRTAEV
ncbi:MAG: Gfo/Idh/MocA family oxidoreductase [Armatimonadetes bacterium]|nr:Gfo/Idh/MocA family oxidoreductase [Armatimonadota bacterium]